jgi:hypothetical protein
MNLITTPLVDAGASGVTMATGEGVCYRCHPILACYIADYPEQVLVCCCKNTECPKCTISREGIGDGRHNYPYRNLQKILQALSYVDDIPRFREECKKAGIKPTFEPFWEKLPYSNIFLSVTPDILHQLYQGILKHLKLWVIEAYGAAEIDARCRRLPPNHNIRIFMKGISKLSKVTGQEHEQISRFLLGLIAELRLPSGMDSRRLVACIRSFLDFLYLARYPSHSDETLKQMENALDAFHLNKGIFIDLGIRENFHLPKLEALNHYITSIKLFGTLDNCDTEYTERLHIDLTKNAYRASNHKDEYPQMTLWLDRKEKMLRHEKFIHWRLSGNSSSIPPLPSLLRFPRELKMTKKESTSAHISDLSTTYNVRFFIDALTRFVAQRKFPTLRGRALDNAAYSVNINFAKISVYHNIKFTRFDPVKGTSDTVDTIHAQPARKDRRGNLIPGRWDPALIQTGAEGLSLRG